VEIDREKERGITCIPTFERLNIIQKIQSYIHASSIRSRSSFPKKAIPDEFHCRRNIATDEGG
jgi:hypothetical protein